MRSTFHNQILILSIIIVSIAAFILGSSACVKLKTAATINDAQLANDFFTGQIEVNAITDMMSALGGIGVDKNSDGSFLPSCVNITADTNATPTFPIKHIVLDFTNADCLNSKYDNQYRKGTAILSWQGRLRDIGNTLKIDTRNYYVNNDRHGIHITLSAHGQDNMGYYFFTFNGVDTIDYAYQSNQRSVLSFTMTKKFINGYYTVSPFDNIYMLTGSFSALSSQHLAYNGTIDSAIVIDNSCYYRFTNGVTTVTPSGYTDRKIEFPNTLKCLNTAREIIDGKTKIINIR